jgi:hypothetical protein
LATLEEFLVPLLHDGVAVLRESPPREDGPPEASARILERAHARVQLAMAGPPLGFEATVAVRAAALLHRACWAQLTRQQRPAELRDVLRMPRPPRGPADHVAADLTLRYLPQVWRRARGVDPADPLLPILAGVLQAWPLSGVLADMEEGPERPVDLGSHHGVLLLYAERYVRHARLAWRPTAAGDEYVALVQESLARGRGPALAGRAAPA